MTTAESFQRIYQRACDRKGGEAALAALLGHSASAAEISVIPDNLLLGELTKKVFQSGFVWRVVRQKWPGFCEVFFDFDIEKILLMSDEMLEAKARDERIIRNAAKVFTIRDNALMIDDIAAKHGSFARFIADWPTTDIIGLWAYLKQHGARLGGNTGPYALRAIGKDTFILSTDVEAYLRASNVFDGGINSKRSLAQIQQQFNLWQQQSGRSLQHISQIIALSVGENYLGMQH
ncbi:MAG: DNA-3-methyladenine glycosylase I [Gammaproteobacteria bacterium]|nr:DNA-3-methyladenine glycosylase I [Gammaproteobacteria bacterium]MBU1554958.1 DNA-3-methyladenine glycosylase I [Gammaproteobacteria bacterium]MBU2070478.1 DNA-3-methyladenine glycosylase I [Gammaproteobacteria bacterium]MBU2185279.1 DNA-3-methyladenine glycosylase I [Gammaproteobacteria bacterium]MBU2205070.1 DNA-3-methyladenine glycosylase I [Gammaproteobacteria bacterium]